MEFPNIFHNSKKIDEKIRNNERMEIERKRIEIDEKRVKIVQPFDTVLLDDFTKRVGFYKNHCQKKKYIFDFFQDMYCNAFYSKCRRRPSLYELEKIIFKAIPKEEEEQLRTLIFHLEGAREQCSYHIFNVHSEIIIDIFYDFCKSLNTKYSGNLSEFHMSKEHVSHQI